MKIQSEKTAKVKPYARNPRRNDAAVAKVAASIREFGWRQPVVIDRDLVIVAGHTRWLAAIHLGLESIPVHIATDLNADQVKAFRLADNRVGEEATWDAGLLRLEVGDLRAAGYGLEAIGFETAELKKIDDLEGAELEPDQPSGLGPEAFGAGAALSRGSAPLKKWRALKLLGGRVLDFGSGNEQHRYACFDPFTAPDYSLLLERYDLVMCNYVLNVQPSDHLIHQACALIARLADRAAFAVVTDPKLSGSAACGGRQAKPRDEWRSLLGEWFEVTDISASFTGFLGSSRVK